MQCLARVAWVCVLQLMVLVGGCSTIASDLDAATTVYRDADYELVERWMDALAVDRAAMSAGERLRYQYLSGMTAYRLGRAREALHHLLLAAALAQRAPDVLDSTDRVLMERTLDELQQSSYHHRG